MTLLTTNLIGSRVHSKQEQQKTHRHTLLFLGFITCFVSLRSDL
jgi:hypothetical protein